MNVVFTEYVLPDGRTRPFAVDRPEDICQKAAELKALGLKLEIEILTTGSVSMTVEDYEKEETIAHHICANGPEILSTIDTLITEAHAFATGIPI